jgi:hypothetical protein
LHDAIFERAYHSAEGRRLMFQDEFVGFGVRECVQGKERVGILNDGFCEVAQ